MYYCYNSKKNEIVKEFSKKKSPFEFRTIEVATKFQPHFKINIVPELDLDSIGKRHERKDYVFVSMI